MFLPYAKKYIEHLKFCKKRSKIILKENEFSEQFRKNGFCTFKTKNSEIIANKILKYIKSEEKKHKDVWDKDSGKYKKGDIFKKFPYIKDLFNNEIKNLVNQIYKSHFSIYYGILYKSSYNGKKPSGSQLWHVDGGPGTCINLMFCLSEINDKNGSMKCLSWENSKKILKKLFRDFYKLNLQSKYNNEDKITVRNKKSILLHDIINKNFKSYIYQPSSGPGLIYAFKNNCIHSGGFPLKNFERYVCVFHIYPNETEFNASTYIKKGVKKTLPYPQNPFTLKN